VAARRPTPGSVFEGHPVAPGEPGSAPTVGDCREPARLDQHHGFHPHTTWSSTTPANARLLLAEIGGRARVLGVTRTSTTRHGAGPLPTEDASLRARLPEPHNGDGGYQGPWRVGHLDAVLLRHAIRACGGIDGLAVTHLDHSSP
jgi:adenylosuccinate synthase